jgi:hypothetical protein
MLVIQAQAPEPPPTNKQNYSGREMLRVAACSVLAAWGNGIVMLGQGEHNFRGPVGTPKPTLHAST